MTPDQRDADLQLAIDGELRLLQTHTRRAPAEVDALLDPEFFEFGASGCRWSRPAILEMLASDSSEGGEVAVALNVEATRIGPGIVLVTYISENDERRCYRSSIWRRTATGWRVLFHQGTPIPSASPSLQPVTRHAVQLRESDQSCVAAARRACPDSILIGALSDVF
ncbi:MAG TPA: DUF4440 domain-containing protein [Streptosporangiaceae bacterium]